MVRPPGPVGPPPQGDAFGEPASSPSLTLRRRPVAPCLDEQGVRVAVHPAQLAVPGVADAVLLTTHADLLEDPHRGEVVGEAASGEPTHRRRATDPRKRDRPAPDTARDGDQPAAK